MIAEEKKRSRGRPKTLDRKQVLDVSMQAYWKEGIEAISLNKICKRTNVSKPGIYREFGNDDGLIKAVLEHYQQEVLKPIHKIFLQNKSFDETLNEYIDILTTNSPNQYGCLFIRTRDLKYPLGAQSQAQIERIQEEFLRSFTRWIERAKNNNEFPKDISTQLAVNYIDAQVSMAMTKIFNGFSTSKLKEILLLAFSVFK
ncbi:TetR/AcrR family transcriptional regulator [Sulfurospirillum sp. 1612]|uniref:TetR/AcrR family transcriptional regulator n=1 Tax=Sulfurospirillum sp. 1612 TaxID=3094835 RepID=UPI002F92CBC0